jgi:hypothetical protein
VATSNNYLEAAVYSATTTVLHVAESTSYRFQERRLPLVAVYQLLAKPL